MADGIFEKVYNPDVLSCLVNLSNDEVFTPPAVANQMLDMLPQELFSNPDAKFLDPATKSGVFLREIAKRLIKGLEHQIPDLNERLEHIFKHQLYGIAITELTSMISRRSLYCSAYPNSEYSVVRFDNAEGNIRFKRINHTWRDGKCVFCGAAESQYSRGDELETHAYEFIHYLNPEEIFNMKFDVIISNPPYQLSDGGNGSSAKPIYNLFIKQMKKLNTPYTLMIIPARWYAGGKGLDDFRYDMLHDKCIKRIIDYPNPKDCFPGLNISGGVCIFLRDKKYESDCEFTNIIGNNSITEMRNLSEFEYFIRYNSAVSIIHKILKFGESKLETIITSRKPFGLDSFVRGNDTRKNGDLTLISSAGKGYIERNKILQGQNLIDKYKVIIGKALSGHIGETDENGQVKVLAKIELLKPQEICTESYLCVGDYDNIVEAQNLEIYIKTKFCRFLLLQALSSMNITKDKFCYVPLQDFTKPWTDEELYQKYNLTDEEISFIESMIKPMDLGGENNAR